MSIERKMTYIFSSDPTKGATNIQLDGSVFSVTMQYPISLPRGTQYATMEVHSASVWYVTPNYHRCYTISINNFRWII
jgi:hypothetical protein